MTNLNLVDFRTFFFLVHKSCHMKNKFILVVLGKKSRTVKTWLGTRSNAPSGDAKVLQGVWGLKHI